ncbi:MAG: hypothetical protein AVDCRST_MAG80-560, partial [uncultured Rubrobacteraceae bacterium]
GTLDGPERGREDSLPHTRLTNDGRHHPPGVPQERSGGAHGPRGRARPRLRGHRRVGRSRAGRQLVARQGTRRRDRGVPCPAGFRGPFTSDEGGHTLEKRGGRKQPHARRPRRRGGAGWRFDLVQRRPQALGRRRGHLACRMGGEGQGGPELRHGSGAVEQSPPTCARPRL